MIALAATHARLRARIAAARGSESGEDAGMVLVYVLIVTMLVTGAVTALLITTTSAIEPTQNSIDTTSAYSAAEAGIQDAVAYINTACPTFGTRCDPVVTAGATGSNLKSNGSVNVLAGSSQAFTWKVDGYVVDASGNRYIRVSSTGRSGGRAKKLVADVQGVRNALDYEYYSTYETNGTADIDALNPANRSVQINCSTVSGAAGSLNFSCPTGTTTSVSWNGATASAPSDSVCNKLWYDSALYDGADGLGRASVQSSQVLAPGADWRESGTANGKTVTRDVPCQVAFSTKQTFDGPAYTVDAPLVSNGTPTGSGPTFSGGLTTAWQSGSSPQAPSTYYRTDPYVGGTLSSPAASRSNPQSFSSSFSPAVPSSACVFSGPTRVKLNGDGTATVTSPQTTTALQTGQAGCYATKNAAGQFTVNYKQYGNGIIYVRNNGTKPAVGYPATGQKAGATAGAGDTAFYLTTAASGYTLPTTTPTYNLGTACSTSSTYSAAAFAPCAYSQVAATGDGPGWTAYSATAKCGTKPATDRGTFECEFNHANTGDLPANNDQYGILRGRFHDDFDASRHPCQTGDVTAQDACAQAIIQSELTTANSHQWAAGTTNIWSSGDHRYLVVAGTPALNKTGGSTMPIGSATSAPLSGDPLFTNVGGSAGTASQAGSTMTFTVTRQVYGCYAKTAPYGVDSTGLSCLTGLLGGAYGWGDGSNGNGAGVPQFAMTLTDQSGWAVTSAPTSAVSYFPSMQDVTQYGTGTSGANGTNGPGDVYIEGNNTGDLSVLADGDAVVTGNLTTAATGAATLIDTLGDVRVYNPMSCVDTTAADIANTAAGFCPNDLTGLYTGGLVTGGTLNASHPAKQYANLLSTPVSTISAALVAQGSSNATGSIRTDNANRGTGDGALTIKGGMYQRHRGTLGVQWEYRSDATTARAQSGYTLAMTYQDLQQAGLNYVPVFQGGSATRYWNVVSVSSVTRNGS